MKILIFPSIFYFLTCFVPEYSASKISYYALLNYLSAFFIKN
ncbi:hypothetical protein HMPREF1502_1400 [Klebsiella sp. AS10]|nr:hypothetical protein HMPREF1502_1400 [Klebsiella sp. AS10]